MNSLLTFCGQVLLSKAIAFFILRNLGNVCQRRTLKDDISYLLPT